MIKIFKQIIKGCDIRPPHIDSNHLTILLRYSFILDYDINIESSVRKRILL